MEAPHHAAAGLPARGGDAALGTPPLRGGGDRFGIFGGVRA
jgi:hypothetical protein